eukprot:TRINITY_DN15486_c0_g1_i1.p1 TRINITY_DN15486_c0_g1~~TRINITY_DN15486_c0_g1_i1.p1  ORF type:complete len:486 (-),score=146.25 TRINITY_DN15486_c0_g1_i1:42-1499(-)
MNLVTVVLILAFGALVAYAFYLLRSFVETKRYTGDKVRLEREHFIPFSDEQIRDAFTTLLAKKGDPNLQRDFATMYDSVKMFFHMKHYPEHRDLIESYSRLENNDKSTVVNEQFVEKLSALLENAHFKPITDKEVDFALQEDYMLTVPVEVNWTKLDDSLLKSHTNKLKIPEGNLPEFSNYMWVFKRGVGVDRTTDLLILEKMDVLIISFLGWINRGISRLVGKPVPGSASNDMAQEQSNSDEVQRITLKGSLKPSHLFSATTLQEPTFKELVLVYQKKNEGLTLRSYRNIPMADMEVLFPEIGTKLRPNDLIKFTVTMCLGILSGIINMDSDESILTSLTFQSFLVLAAKTAVDYYFAMYYYESLVIRFMHDKAMDNNKGVLLYLLDETTSQEFKETIVAYYFALELGKSTEHQVDEAAERFLKEMTENLKFNVKGIDFDAPGGLKKLAKMGLVTQEGDKYVALPIQSAIKTLPISPPRGARQL